MKKLFLKIWWCYIFNDHEWTSPGMKGETIYLSPDDTRQQVRIKILNNVEMICDRCGHESKVSKEFRVEFLKKSV